MTIKLLIGCTNLNTKPVTELYLKTLEIALNEARKAFFGIIPLTVEVVVNIWGKEDNCIELKSKYPSFNWIENDRLGSCAEGWNKLIKFGYDNAANPLFDYYLVMNNDVYWTVNSLTNFIKGLEQNNGELGFISFMGNDFKEPELTGINETIQVENRYWNGLRAEADDVISCDQLENIIKTTYAPFGGIEKFADNLTKKYGTKPSAMHQKSFGFALSKECIEKVGLFDEYNSENGGIHEDADYGQRLKMANVKVGFIPGAYLHHLSMLTRTKGKYKESWWVEAREKAFQEKWGVSSKEMDKIPANKGFRVDLCSGERPRRDGHWLHADIDSQFPDVEYLLDISKPLPFNEDSIEEIYCSNGLEHQEWKKILSILYDWYGKIKKGGKIEIRVPNFRFAVERYLEGSWKLSLEDGVDFNLSHLLFGGDHEGCAHVHKVGLDYQNLGQALKDVGFSNIRDMSDSGSWELRLTAEK